MRPAHTLVSPTEPKRRIWPWLLLLLAVSIGVSFAVVLAFVAWRRPREVGPAPIVASVSEATASASVQATTRTTASVVPSAAPSHLAVHAAPHASATTAATATATATAATNPPPPTKPIGIGATPLSSTPMSGVMIDSSSSDGSDCGDPSRTVLASLRPRVSLCFNQFRYDTPEHESVDYVFWVDAAGVVTRVERYETSPDVPRFDTCVASVIRTTPMPIRSCWMRVAFGAPCIPNWFGQCSRDAGP